MHAPLGAADASGASVPDHRQLATCVCMRRLATNLTASMRSVCAQSRVYGGQASEHFVRPERTGARLGEAFSPPVCPCSRSNVPRTQWRQDGLDMCCLLRRRRAGAGVLRIGQKGTLASPRCAMLFRPLHTEHDAAHASSFPRHAQVVASLGV